MINVLRNWGKTVVMWNMALDATGGPTVQHGCGNCRGIVTIDTSTTPATVSRNVEYYALGHLAKFVETGAYRIESNSFGSGSIEDVAFKNPDGSIAVLVYNAANAPSDFSLNWKGKTVSSASGGMAMAGRPKQSPDAVPSSTRPLAGRKPLAGLVAVVAGATRGAERGIARALGEAGARFIALDEVCVVTALRTIALKL